VKHIGLELKPFRPTELSEVAFLKGKRVKMPADKPVDMCQIPLDLTTEERKNGLDNLEGHYFGELMRKLGYAIREDWPPEVTRLVDISMKDFLSQRGASADAIQYMLGDYEEIARDENSHVGQPKSKIKGGNDQLPRAFAAKLGDMIRYGCVVEHIERGDNRLRIDCRHEGMLDRVEAEAVILHDSLQRSASHRCHAGMDRGKTQSDRRPPIRAGRAHGPDSLVGKGSVRLCQDQVF
jgi:hypothetical protein